MKIYQLIALCVLTMIVGQCSYAVVVRQIIFEKTTAPTKRIAIEGDSHRADGVLAAAQANKLVEIFSQARHNDPKTYLYLEQPEPRTMALYLSLDSLIYKYSKALTEEADRINREAGRCGDSQCALFFKDVLDKAQINLLNENRNDELLFALGSQLATTKNVFFLDNRIVFSQIGNVFMLGESAPRLKGYKAYDLLLKEIEKNSLTFEEFFDFINNYMTDTETMLERLKDSVREPGLLEAIRSLNRLVPYLHAKVKALESLYDKDKKFFSWVFAQFEKEQHSAKLSTNLSTLAGLFIKLDTYFVELFDLKVLAQLEKKTSGTHIIVTGHQHAQNLADEFQAERCSKVYDSLYQREDGKTEQRIEELFDSLGLNHYSEIEALRILQAKVLPLPLDAFRYVLPTNDEMNRKYWRDETEL